MPRPSNYHEIPKPSSAVSARNRLEPGALDERTLSRLWRPRAGSLLEVMLSTISRVSLRLIDRVTGEAYSADELEAKILEALGAGADPAWEDISGKPTSLAGYGITDAAPAAMIRTAEQGPPLNFNHEFDFEDTENPSYDGVYRWLGFTSSGDPVWGRTTDTQSIVDGVLTGSGFVFIQRAIPDVYSWSFEDGSAGWEFSPNTIYTQVIPSATRLEEPYPADGLSDAAPDPIIFGSIRTIGTTPAAPGQICIVNQSDAYVAVRVSPAYWVGPLNP